MCSYNRIQKLLLSEYCDFEDVVLIESPFAQTDKEGNGIRQIHLGLTPTKLVLAADILDIPKESACFIPANEDPLIYDFELVAVFPLECVSLSVYHRKRKFTIKVKLCTKKIWYFELGGSVKRHMIWKKWLERINYINKTEQNSQSETSAGSSSTDVTSLNSNVTKFRKVNSKLYKPQVWCNFCGKSKNLIVKDCKNWTDKYLFLGQNYEESSLDYTPVVYFPTKCNLLCSEKMESNSSNCACDNIDFCTTKLPHRINRIGCGLEEKCKSRYQQKYDVLIPSEQNGFHVNRFGMGIDEKCITGLSLPTDSYIKLKHFKKIEKLTETKSSIVIIPDNKNAKTEYDINHVEEIIKIWESSQKYKSERAERIKHERKYAIQPDPEFSQNFGAWDIRTGEKFSIQSKDSLSEVNLIKTEPIYGTSENKTSQIFSSNNLTNITANSFEKINNNRYQDSFLPFWTPEKCSQNNLKTEEKTSQSWYTPNINNSIDTTIDKINVEENLENKTIILYQTSPEKWARNCSSSGSVISSRKPSVNDLPRILRVELNLTAWDFDSGTLAYQLTTIDRDLFLNISTYDIASLIFHESCYESPNLRVAIKFSKRITCLVGSEILKNDSVQARARMISRFINTANCCKRIANYQSCGSIMNGLRVPPVFRLKKTWNYLRKSHSTQYQMFYELCKLYKDVKSFRFHEEFNRIEKIRPYFLPYIGYFIALLLGKTPKLEEKGNEIYIQNSSLSSADSTTTVVKKLFSTIRLLTPMEMMQNRQQPDGFTKFENDRKERLAYALQTLEKFKSAAENYQIKKNKLVREYLLKAKHENEIQLFKKSLIIE